MTLAWLGTAADAVAVGVAASGVIVGFLRQSSRFRSRLLTTPLRRAARALARRDRSAAATFRELSAGVSDAVLRASRQLGDVLPADVIAELQANRGPCSWRTTASPLARLLEDASAPHMHPFLARVLYPEEARRVSAVIRDVAIVARRFAACALVDSARQQAPTTQDSFGAFVTALTGAPVLVDTSGTRARFAEHVLMWHSFAYRNPLAPPAPTRRYETDHEGAGGCSLWHPHERLPGDYDLRVLEPLSVGLVEATPGGFLAFVVETAETCYAVTEHGDQGIGCKHVGASWATDGAGPVFSAVSDHDGFRFERHDLRRARVTMLTAYVSLITADRQLALARRSKKVRHGASVLSATAGGIVEPDGAGTGGDVDELGVPDVFRTVDREAQEEIGVTLDRPLCRPVCLFLANIRGATERTADDGQVVAVILFLERVPETLVQLQVRAATTHDPARGGYEQEGIVGCPLSSPAEIAAWARSRATELDQHGILSCLYASMATFEAEPTRDAFSEVFADEPWWAISPYRDGSPRLVRDPAHLAPAIPVPPPGVPAAWAQAFERTRATVPVPGAP